MATELASGFISLSVKYSSAMRQIDQDFSSLEGTAKRAGTDAGNALSTSLGRAARLDQGDAKRTFSTIEAAAKRSGSDAGQELGQGVVSGARREVESTGKSIFGGLGEGIKQAGSEGGESFLGGMAPKLTELGTKAGPIGAALAAAVGLAAVAGGLLAKEVAAGFERDMANRKLEVQLGINKADVANVNTAITNAYKNNFGESVDALREDAASIIKNGLVQASDTQGLQSALQQFDTVAQVTGSSVDEIARSVGVLVKSGVAKDTASALDLITVAAQKGLDVSGDLMDTLTEYSVQFKKIGIDGPQALGLIKQLMDGGARSTDLAADALKEFSIRSIDGSKTTVDAYTKIGVNADEMAQKLAAGGPAATQAFSTIVQKLNAIQDPVQRNAAGVELFGTQWEDLGGAIQKLDPSKAVADLGQVDGAVKQATDTLGSGGTAGFQTFSRSLEVLRGKFQDFLAKAFGPLAKSIGDWITNSLPKLGELFQNTILPAIQSVMPAIKDFASGIFDTAKTLGGQWLDNIKAVWPEVQKFGSALKNAFVGYLPIIKGVAEGIGAVILVAMKISGVVLPVVIKGFTLLADGLAFIYNTVVPAIVGGFTAIADGAMFLWNNAIQPAWTGISTVFSTGWAIISAIFDAFKTAISTVGTVFGAIFNDFILPMWHNFETIVGAAWSVIQPIFSAMGDAFSAVGTAFSTVFSSVFGPVWDGIKNVFSEGWNFISGVFDSLKGGFQSVADFISGVWNGIAGIVKGALDGIVGAIRPALHAIGSVLSSVPSNLGPIEIPGAGTANALGAKLQAFATGGKVQGPGGTDNVLAWLTAGEGVVTKDAMANGGATMVAALNNGWVPPVEMIRSMVGHIPGFAEGLNPGADYLRSQIMQLWPQITSIGGRRAEDGFGEHSSGNAIDVMIPGWDTPQGKALGDSVASFVSKNAQALGLDGFIWRQTSYGYGGSFDQGKQMSDRGSPTQNHMDHVHIILGKGRGAGAPAVNVPTQTLSLPTGGSVSPGSASSSSGGGGATTQQLSAAQDKVTDTQNRADTAQMALDEAKTKGTTGSALKSKQDAADKAKREADQAKQDLETLKQKGPASDSKSAGSNSDNPFSKIAEGIGQLADLGKDGLIESLLPPGFNNPLDGSLLKSGAAVLNFAGSLTKDPTAKGILGIGAQALGGSPSGVINGIASLIPQPFGNTTPVGASTLQPGDAVPHVGSGALPGPANLAAAFTPDPNANANGGVVNNDNSVHVAEGGQINQNAEQILDKTKRQQTAQQQPQLGTRRFI